ncbi:MAG: hypothetical protein INQ03_16130 [Candidatus Heimdallarchaeota archaeon]|nr:hypothetical protein [Candidatus Heimdallarchaeota archaeon]
MSAFPCAWCNKEMNLKPIVHEGNVSHSICIDCIIELEIFEIIEVTEDFFNEIPFGETVINKQNEVSSFTTTMEFVPEKIIYDYIGKNYFDYVIPQIKNKDIMNKLGGLKRRNSNGIRTFHFILKRNGLPTLIELELSHFINSGETVIKLEILSDTE